MLTIYLCVMNGIIQILFINVIFGELVLRARAMDMAVTE